MDRKAQTTSRDPLLVISVLVITLAAMLLVVYSGGSASQPQRVGYSAFKELVAKHAIESVVITPTELRGKPAAAAGATPAQAPSVYVAERVEDPSLVAYLEAHQIPYAGESGGSWWVDLAFRWILPLAIVFFFWNLLLRNAGPRAAPFSFGRSRAKLVAPEEVGVSFADVAGVDEAKEELREVVEFLQDPMRFARLGARIPKGVLLVGPPGTGKTLLARAVAGEAKVPFFSLTGSEFVEMFVGVGAARVRDLFSQAQAHAPCIIFIDELDALGKARGATLVANEEREQTLNQLLAEMDGFDPRKGVIIMAATNRPETLDPALLRPGRFDRQILVDRPDIGGREAILRVHARGIRLAPAVDLRTVAAATPGFAGADLANLLNEAALLATRRGKEAVDGDDLQDAIERIVAGLEKKTRVMNPQEKRRIAHHEAGHALVGARLAPDNPVRKISIIPRGLGALGYTLQLPLEDRYLMTREELADKLAVLLAGRAAEEVSFGTISTGAADDLRRATDIAGRMIREYGMSEKLGPLTFETEPTSPLLGIRAAPHAAHYSEHTAEAIDEDVEALVTAAHERARKILERERPLLERMASVLLEHEALEGEELARLLEPDKPGAEPAAAAVGVRALAFKR
jgi:cell division protease FtsH